ncbi:hypothetical protein AXG93_2403s1000 [Marchantia polymorpha subsp. ruderalis]|uniref:Uncharacterized protein n=1 Tax=Marchantia polymorpha subsp. ruderalis TaxID=1480154 RepID=A0A176VTE7_MARPO|nr:hypothetical protein AXG93_2403s1000 [Marchantia polymorpha subsp. ruderalis]
MALDEVAAKVVEDVCVAKCEPQKVASPQTFTGIVILKTYLDKKQEKYAEATIPGSYVEIVRNRTRIKVVAAIEVAAKELGTSENPESIDGSELLRVDELTARAEKKEQEYDIKLALRAKKLA